MAQGGIAFRYVCGRNTLPRASRPRKLHQRRDIALVGGLQRRHIPPPRLAQICQILPAPTERPPPQPDGEQIPHEPRTSPIAIRKRVNGHQLVMHPDCDLVGRNVSFPTQYRTSSSAIGSSDGIRNAATPMLRSVRLYFPAHDHTSPNIRLCSTMTNDGVKISRRCWRYAHADPAVIFSCSATLSSCRNVIHDRSRPSRSSGASGVASSGSSKTSVIPGSTSRGHAGIL